ncbi:slr1659 superfamily regulator [Rhodospirillum sp. A1_3_36]|uniref:slr1659 superfamily regulator n=1 Tax=Rhodospirillum sp. A1_3_36 TaxID=3391666 RepID=UPI0039A6086C
MIVIDGATYKVERDDEQGRVTLSGTLRLNGLTEYEPLAQILRDGLDHYPTLTLDLRKLDFLNSSGIAMLSKFVIEARDRDDHVLSIVGSKAVAWQGKSLVNLRRLMPTLALDFQ